MYLKRALRAARALFVLGLSLGGAREAPAQSLTSGSLKGRIITRDGNGVVGVQLTLEGRLGGTIREFESDRDGSFRLALLAPGEYRLLAELPGYQPVRRTGIVVAAGRATVFEIRIEKRPPPITTVDEVAGQATQVGTTGGRVYRGTDISDLARRRDIADVSRQATELVAATDGREGFAIAASGRPASQSRLFVDGLLETLLKHPGYPDEPARTPVFSRGAVDQAQIIGVPLDAEWRGTTGSIFAVQTRRAAGKIQFQPYATFSTAKLGGRALDNPGDSAASSFQVGAVLSGAVVPDTAHFVLGFDYQQLEQPGARPWERDTASYRGVAGSLAQTIGAVASDSFGTQVGSLVAPPVRTYKGGNGFGRLDWQLGATTTLLARAGFASWKEQGWAFGEDLASGAGSSLNARDGSAAISVTSASGPSANELRFGFNLARREYAGTNVINTSIVSNGAGFGTPLGLPGLFDSKVVDFSDAYQHQFGDHRLKFGMSLSFLNYSQDYRYGSAGAYTFGDIDGFGLGRGSYFGLSGPAETAQFTTKEFGLFVQDAWNITPEIQVFAGFRYDRQSLPAGKVLPNAAWLALTGVRNDSIPKDKRGFAPRVSFVWDVQNKGDWIVRGGGGVYLGRMDPTTLAEAILFDQNVTVNRGIAAFATWPIAPDAALAPAAGQRLTVISTTYRNPRSAKYEFGVSRRLSDAMFHLSASYQHSDYLLRRQDLNRAAQVGTTQEGRPVYGTLVQRASLVVPQVGSNRRFSDFDLVSGLVPTGFVDHYEVSALLERRLSDRLSFSAAYTYSQTTDNLVGARSPDPADQLSPFPDGLNGGDWTKGTSDFAVPHRAALSASYRTPGASGVSLGARYRIRSGLSFTPGFRPGVDANGDGSGNNDPALLGGNVAGVAEALAQASCTGGTTGAFAVRNSCRADMQQALDLSFSVGLPVGTAKNRVVFRVDAFNVVATATGVVDRALVLIDPTKSLTTDPSGNVSLPLVANSKFGSLLIRRGEPRMVRVGLSLEY